MSRRVTKLTPCFDGLGSHTMSAQQRYRTLAHYISRVYSAEDGLRTDTMKTGLDEITAVVNPHDSRGWATVGGDSGRLLKVWEAKENNPAAAVVAAQIADLLTELAAEVPAPATAPVLVVQDHIQHVHPFGYHQTPITTRPVPTDEMSSIASLEEAEASEESDDSASVASSVKQVTITAAPAVPLSEEAEATDDEVEVNHLEEDSEAAEAAEEESEKASTASVHEAEEDEEEAEEEEEASQVKINGKMYWLEKASQILYEVADGDEVGDEVGKMVDGKPVFNKAAEAEEEVVEPDAEEEEEEESGMNVEQVMIRGRAYWLEVDTKKLYAVVGDDDLGDEVGEMMNGKPRFYAK
jgi:hypothetical protein